MRLLLPTIGHDQAFRKIPGLTKVRPPVAPEFTPFVGWVRVC
jgi:hypothetical protein